MLDTQAKYSTATVEPIDAEAAKKLAAFNCITDEFRKLNITEPLSTKFDDAISHRMKYSDRVEA